MENANEAIYLGIYTMIFVIALSLTIFLFSSLMEYTDEAYEYMHRVGNDSVTISAEENRNLILTGQEVVSYYYNYVKKDRFSDETYNSNTIVTINLNTSNEAPLILDSTNLTYKEVIEKIGANNRYILSVDNRTNDTTTYINITKATDEELQEMW